MLRSWAQEGLATLAVLGLPAVLASVAAALLTALVSRAWPLLRSSLSVRPQRLAAVRVPQPAAPARGAALPRRPRLP